MQKHVLSKSTFIRGLKCSKSLYLNKHNRNLKDELSEMQKAIFNQGDMVGSISSTAISQWNRLYYQNILQF